MLRSAADTIVKVWWVILTRKVADSKIIIDFLTKQVDKYDLNWTR